MVARVPEHTRKGEDRAFLRVHHFNHAFCSATALGELGGHTSTRLGFAASSHHGAQDILT